MEKIIHAILYTLIITLTAFSDINKEEKIIIAEFEVDNQASTTQQLKIKSITNSQEEIIFEILPLSKVVFQIEKNKEEWKDSEIKVVDGTHEKEIISRYIHNEDIIAANKQESYINHDKKFNDLSLGYNSQKDTGNELVVIDKKTHELYIENKILNMEYEINEDEEREYTEDEKIYKKIKITIAGQEEHFKLQLDAQKEPNRKQLAPYFYEITGNNINPDTPIYLLGTAHTLAPEDYSEEIRNKIEKTEILISEFPKLTDTTAAEDTLNIVTFIYNKFIEQDLYWFRDQFIALKYSPDTIKEALILIQEKRNELLNPDFFQSWFNEFTEAEKGEITKISSKTEIELTSIHPTILSWIIIITEELLLDKQYIEDSLETYLIKLFTTNNKEVIHLDTLETLLWANTHEFLECLQTSLYYSLNEIRISIEKYGQCSPLDKDPWLASHYFEALDLPSVIASPVDASTAARNIAWQEKVIAALNSGKSASIITGTAHLKGETGLINLLQSQGFKIKHVFIEINDNDKLELNRINNIDNWRSGFALTQDIEKIDF